MTAFEHIRLHANEQAALVLARLLGLDPALLYLLALHTDGMLAEGRLGALIGHADLERQQQPVFAGLARVGRRIRHGRRG